MGCAASAPRSQDAAGDRSVTANAEIHRVEKGKGKRQTQVLRSRC